ncbi:MAG: hypothetical protein Q8M02_02715 [Candidatus Didemnitutus sp.]|nr:hypothetical protein [Candidatus Didemnitutus sp.]
MSEPNTPAASPHMAAVGAMVSGGLIGGRLSTRRGTAHVGVSSRAGDYTSLSLLRTSSARQL